LKRRGYNPKLAGEIGGEEGAYTRKEGKEERKTQRQKEKKRGE
jgi:hypothetical protein